MRFFCFFLFLFISSLAYASDPAWEKINKTSTVEVALDFNLPFDTCLLTRDRITGKLGGLELHLIEFIAKAWNVKISWKQSAWEHLILSINKERAQFSIQEFYIPLNEDSNSAIIYSDPYLKSGLAILHKKNDKITKKPDFNGKKVGAFDDPWVSDYIKRAGYQKVIRYYAEENDMFEDFKKGKLQYVIYDRPLLNAFLEFENHKKDFDVYPSKKGFLEGSQGSYGAVIKKGNNTLRSEVNKVIAKWKTLPEVIAKVKACALEM